MYVIHSCTKSILDPVTEGPFRNFTMKEIDALLQVYVWSLNYGLTDGQDVEWLIRVMMNRSEKNSYKGVKGLWRCEMVCECWRVCVVRSGLDG